MDESSNVLIYCATGLRNLSSYDSHKDLLLSVFYVSPDSSFLMSASIFEFIIPVIMNCKRFRLLEHLMWFVKNLVYDFEGLVFFLLNE
jgi:hypothetical protein